MIKIITTTHNNNQNKSTATMYFTNTLQKSSTQQHCKLSREIFCINEVLAKIENNSLKISLPEYSSVHRQGRNYEGTGYLPGILPCIWT